MNTLTNDDGTWMLYEHLVSGQSNITISGSGAIDELRLYPKDALVTTYTYDPLIGMTSQSDASGKIVYYDYDPFGRLFLIKDQNKNILKKYCYSYSGQEGSCGVYRILLQSQAKEPFNMYMMQLGIS
jgi:YD repeat-containing protein